MYRIERAHVRELKLVKPLWQNMLAIVRDLSRDTLPVRDVDEAWRYRHQEYMTWINDGTGAVIIAWDGDAPVGYAAVRFIASGSAFDSGEQFGVLESLTVRAEDRGRGVGRQLIERCRQELAKREITHWSVDLLAKDIDSISLCEHRGFSPFMVRLVQEVSGEVPMQTGDDLTGSINVISTQVTFRERARSGPDDQAAPAAASGSAGLGTVGGPGTGAVTAPAPGESEAPSDVPADASDEREQVATEKVHELARAAREASRVLALLSRAEKDLAVQALADALELHQDRILAANAEDLTRGREAGMATGLQDRLRLDEKRLRGIADALRAIAGLPDPVGEVVRGYSVPNGLQLRQVRVPMGVVGIIYEARPNVTVDAAGLALKSGNAVLLRGGSAAAASNAELVDILRETLAVHGLPADAICLLDDADGRAGATALMRARGLVDVIIPRGGAELIATVVRESQVPVIETGSGNVHVYVDAKADLDKASDIVINSKTHRPSVCNAAETLLVHEAVADTLLPDLLRELYGRGVVLYGDEPAIAAGASEGVPVHAVTEELFDTEFHGMEMSVGVVGSIDEAMEHVRRYSTGHTEAIVTEDRAAARRWVNEVDAAVVMVNASTRFTDGGEFGMGAEIGISTQKLHARGPMALPELTTTKWIVEGDGHVRV